MIRSIMLAKIGKYLRGPFLLMALAFVVFGAAKPSILRAAEIDLSVVAIIEQELGSTIAQASTEKLGQSLQALVAKTPAKAPDLVVNIGLSGRGGEEMSQYVRAAIVGLGSEPSLRIILEIIRVAVAANPSYGPAIVAAAIPVSPLNLADDIVEIAVASLPNPTLLIGGVTLTEAIARAAIAALASSELPPGADGAPDAAAIFIAANRGLQSSLSSLFGAALVNQSPVDPQAVNKNTVITEAPAASQ